MQVPSPAQLESPTGSDGGQGCAVANVSCNLQPIILILLLSVNNYILTWVAYIPQAAGKPLECCTIVVCILHKRLACLIKPLYTANSERNVN